MIGLACVVLVYNPGLDRNYLPATWYQTCGSKQHTKIHKDNSAPIPSVFNFFLLLSVYLSLVSMSSSLTLLSLNPPFHHKHKPHSTLILFPIPKLPSLSLFKSHICHSSSEEIRWLREEQRWLREEQRWLREEQRWARERDSLLREISDLKLKIQALEGASSVLEAQGLMLQGLKEKGLIAETGLEEEKKKKKKKEEEVIRVSKKQTLRKGSEGAEVQAMQVCSHSLIL